MLSLLVRLCRFGALFIVVWAAVSFVVIRSAFPFRVKFLLSKSSGLFYRCVLRVVDEAGPFRWPEFRPLRTVQCMLCVVDEAGPD